MEGNGLYRSARGSQGSCGSNGWRTQGRSSHEAGRDKGGMQAWFCLPHPQGAAGAADVNTYHEDRMGFRLGKALTMAMRGSACFDFPEYRARSRDLPPDIPDAGLWDHFIHDGQFEGRPFRQASSRAGSASQHDGLCATCGRPRAGKGSRSGCRLSHDSMLSVLHVMLLC